MNEARIYCVAVVCCVVFLIQAACGQRYTVVRQTYGRRPSNQASCSDKNGIYCTSFRARGYCGLYSRYNGYMRANCAKTCGFCFHCYTDCRSVLTTGIPRISLCFDAHDNCALWALGGHCRNGNRKTMLWYCRLSCDECFDSGAVSHACQDRNIYCNSWARKGECVRNKQYMLQYCRKSCKKCPVNGNWGRWGSFSKCTKSCNKGTMTRYRACNNPRPANKGRNCVGPAREIRACNTQPCKTAINGNWGSWTAFGKCGKSCGKGSQTRTRACNNPAPRNGGRPCNGLSRERRECNSKPCPIDGKWSAWGSWIPCSVTCGRGDQTRQRTCDNPEPKHGGKTCKGSNLERQSCSMPECSKDVDGNWGSWTSWSKCSRTCNGGHTERTRDCNNPVPQGGGMWCDGQSYEKKACNTRRCAPKPVLPPFTCGRAKTSTFSIGRIVGGSVADVRDWPWQAGLKKGLDERIICGGTLINWEWVLTAAHCIDRLNPSRTGCVVPDTPLRVILGEFDVNNKEGHEQEMGVAQICMHPKYDTRTLVNDIALLRLSRPPTFNSVHVRPACLPTNITALPPLGTNCTVTGFGRVAERGKLSTKLRKASIPVLRRSYCRSKYPAHTVSNDVICAGYEGGLIDSCKGDSGGPFVCKDPQDPTKYLLQGAVSWGVGCARKAQPGVYTQVRSFLPWINDIVQNV